MSPRKLKDDNTELWRQYASSRSVELRNKLVELYLPLAAKAATIACRRCPQFYDDTYSAACLALVQTVEAFDGNRGLRFSTFAFYRMRGAIADWWRMELPKGYRRKASEAPIRVQLVTLSIESDQGRCSEPSCLAVDDNPHPTDLEYELEFWNKLQPRTQQVLKMRFESGMTMKAIGKVVGLSESRISQMMDETLARLRETSQYARAA